MNILTVSHLNKRFGEQVAISNLSFSIPRQARMAIFAPSGSGKTTLLQILARIEQPDSGSFRVDDSRPVVIFQEPRLFPHLTVEENVFLPYRVQQKPVGEQTLQDYRAWLRVCELESFQQYFPHQLSGGMKQKVALIRGLLQKPDFVMMDEPFQSIGRQAKREIIAHLLATNPKVSMLLVTHDPEEVQVLSHSALYFSTNFLGKYNLVETSQNNFRAV